MTAVALIRMMNEEELKTIEEEVIGRQRVLGCESDLYREPAKNRAPYTKKGGKSWGWEKHITSLDEDALANGKGFYALGGAFLKKGESPKGCILQRLQTGDYVAWKDGVELATTNKGEEAGFTGKLGGVNTHPHSRVLWALWKELK